MFTNKTQNLGMRFSIAIACLILSGNLNSQVTIGADTAPADGALLQLTQDANYSNNANSTKGLALPRVTLTILDNISNIPSAVGQEATHVGLMVYNINEDICALPPIYKGVYVWNGTNWIRLGESDDNYLTYYDQEDNAFKARSFGDAGIWMVENLKVTTFANGANGGRPNPTLNGGGSTANAYYAYPNTINTPSTSPYNEGLLYNYSAASNYYRYGVTPSIDQGQQDASTTPGNREIEVMGPDGPDSKGEKYVQGICPNDWHLPSDREWNELEKEIYNNADKYSAYTKSDLPFSSVPWQTSWEYGAVTGSAANRGSSPEGHGSAMMNRCFPSTTNGKSLFANQGGFDALPVGYIEFGDTKNSYGALTYMWSSSYYDNGTGTSYTVYIRSIYPSMSTVRRIAVSPSTLSSIRCKKND